MIISQEIWNVSTGIALERDGNDVTFFLSGSASGYEDPDLGYWVWYGYMELTFGQDTGYVYQEFDRPMDLSLTQTLVPGTETTGSYYVEGAFSQNPSGDFSVVLFDAAATYAGTTGTDYVFGSAAADRLSGGLGDDGLEGADGNDRIDGGRGADVLYGNQGDDKLAGRAGKDRLNGGEGNDTLMGGGNADRFVFDADFGRDHVTDFRDNVDTVVFDDVLWGGGLTLAQVISNFASVVVGGVLFDFGDDEVFFSDVGSTAVWLDDIVIV